MGSHAEDATVGGAMARGTFEVSMTVEADTPQDAIDTGSRAISSAMQAAGGFVPGWSPEWITARANRISKGARARS